MGKDPASANRGPPKIAPNAASAARVNWSPVPRVPSNVIRSTITAYRIAPSISTRLLDGILDT